MADLSKLDFSANQHSLLTRPTRFKRRFLLAWLTLTLSWGGEALASDEIIDTVGNTINTTTSYPSDLHVGSAGTGTLTIENGGTVSATTGYIGYGTGSNGTVTVTGTGRWNNSDELVVGESGTGTLTIENGGTVNNTHEGTVGHLAGSNGTVTVTGSGSTLTTNTRQLAIGWSGTGEMTISDGGAVSNSYGFIGARAGGSGTVTVTGPGSTWTNSDQLILGLEASTGTLTIANGGTVINTSGRIGLDTGSNGTVTVTGANSTLTDNGTILRVGANGTGTLTVADGGLVTVGTETSGTYDGTLSIASNAGSVGTVNIGAASGSAATAAGTLKAASIAFGSGTGKLVFNHTGTAYTFDANISGSGQIIVENGVTTLTGNSGAFVGTTTVQAGTLNVNGTLGGALDIQTNGRLQGSGTVGNLNINGVIAPGNSIGTLNVAGNITFNAGSVYEVETNAAGQADKINASGTATINGGSVKVLAATGNYAPETTYTILSATNGVSGTFTEGVTSNLAFLDPSLSYDANNVYLRLTRNNLSFDGIGLTANQIATGKGTESLKLGNSIYNTVLNLSSDQARYAFDQLSGELHASLATTLIEDSHFVRNAMNDRLRVKTTESGVWGQAFGSWGNTNGNSNAAKMDRSMGGFLFGADTPAFDTWRFGAVAGYSYTSFDVKDRHSSGSSDNYHLGFYGGSDWGQLGFRSGLAYTWHNIDTTRSVIFPGFSDRLSSGYNAGTFQAFSELSQGIENGVTKFEPFVNLSYVNFDANSLHESGGAAALTGSGVSMDTLFTTLGFRTTTSVNLGQKVVTARSLLGWRHAYGDTTPAVTMNYTSGSSEFTMGGVPIARDAAVVEAGFDFTLSPTATLGISYNGQFANHLVDQSFKANLSMKF
jgi:outer membrane autotransporter protein